MAKTPGKFVTAFRSYKSIEQIGQGGSGRVFAVSDEDGDRFALKLIDPSSITSEKLKRFHNEVGFCLGHRHPGIIRITDTGYCDLDDGRKAPFYVMPLYETTLRKLIDTGLPPDRALAIMIALLEALASAHEANVCHRDLKPQNVLIDGANGSPVIADFGIARFMGEFPSTVVETRDDSRLANFEYAAPEQRRGAAVDYRADLYSLAMIGTELFTGIVPHGLGAPKISGVHPQFGFLDAIFEQMREQEPSRRPLSALEVLRFISKARTNLPVLTPHDPLTQESSPAPSLAISSLRSQASRLSAQLAHEKVRRDMLGSTEGITAAEASVERIRKTIAALAEDLSADLPSKPQVERTGSVFELKLMGVALSIDFQRVYAHTLDRSILKLDFWSGSAPLPGRSFFEEPARLAGTTYKPDFSADRSMIWTQAPATADAGVSENDVAIYGISRLLELAGAAA